MFFLITGAPGSSKTLNLIDMLRNVTDRPIYYHGINELKLPWIQIENPQEFHLNIPESNCIVVIDEAQKHFPQRPLSKAAPSAIKWIETHRHLGIDVYFITQHPNLIDHNARKLVNEHIHLLNPYGLPYSIKYHASKLIDIGNKFALKEADRKIYKYPKDCFNLYKSAESHTKKAKFPLKLLMIPVLAAFTIYFGYDVYSQFASKEPAKTESNKTESMLPSLIPSTISTKETPIQWNTAFTPAIPGLPYTAPFYKDLAKPNQLPVIAGCVASKTKCSCFTQQATLIQMDETLCRENIKHKAFNPFKLNEPQQQYAKPESRQLPTEEPQNRPRFSSPSNNDPKPWLS